MTITLLVAVSIPVTLEFDTPPSQSLLRECALENFLTHPAVENGNTADLGMYLDSIKVMERVP